MVELRGGPRGPGPFERPFGPLETPNLRGYKGTSKRPPEITRQIQYMIATYQYHSKELRRYRPQTISATTISATDHIGPSLFHIGHKQFTPRNGLAIARHIFRPPLKLCCNSTTGDAYLKERVALCDEEDTDGRMIELG